MKINGRWSEWVSQGFLGGSAFRLRKPKCKQRPAGAGAKDHLCLFLSEGQLCPPREQDPWGQRQQRQEPPEDARWAGAWTAQVGGPREGFIGLLSVCSSRSMSAPWG